MDGCSMDEHIMLIIVMMMNVMNATGGPKEFLPVLRAFIGEDYLPTNYGGNRPALGEIWALVCERMWSIMIILVM